MSRWGPDIFTPRFPRFSRKIHPVLDWGNHLPYTKSDRQMRRLWSPDQSTAFLTGDEMYELIILSLLMRFPLHGYLIAQIANDMIGPWARMSNGTLYPLLSKLESSGLITRASHEQDNGQTDQQARTLVITDEGRKRFYQVMMDTSSNVGDYQRIFHLKVPYLDLLPPPERQHLLNHYDNYCQACLLHIKTHAENLEHELAGKNARSPLFKALALQTMQERARLWQAEIHWIGQLRQMLASAGEDGGATA